MGRIVNTALAAGVCVLLGCAIGGAAAAESFTTFESGQVRPLALSPDGSRLFARQHAGQPARDLRRRRRRR